ncbi:DUF6843 domain-containing protein [Halalkalibacter kiskunsagensis]|uniref:DUF6843 domain-containing protein n=1 Tax=Halalkalibacter kiskunsagensis TaxID=1548599 RepID=A0ABV6K9K8_9BACI
MKLIKVLLGSLTLSVVIALIVATVGSIRSSKTEPGVYSFSFTEILFWALYYITPTILIFAVIVLVVYIMMDKATSASRLIKVIVAVVVAGGIVSVAIYMMTRTDETNGVYLIPEGYEGDVFVFYNVPGTRPVKVENDYFVHKINDHGYFVTSTQDMRYGSVTDRYYYVDETGTRTEIDRQCIYLFPTGGYSEYPESGEGITDLYYSGFEVTTVGCGQDFMAGEQRRESVNFDRVIQEVVRQYFERERE